jgi:nicotinamide-nucleotide amidase
MQVEVINTGTELLLGQVVNTHVGYMGERLLGLGLRIARQSTVPDGVVIKGLLTEAIDRSRIILVTGGLGPTSDDLSREMTAECLDLKMTEDAAVIDSISRRFSDSAVAMRPSNRRQAMVPEGAEVLENDKGTAPGLYLIAGSDQEPVHIFLLPGPPRELYPMFEDQVIPRLHAILSKDGVDVPVCRNYFFMGLGESELAGRIEESLNGVPGDFEIGYCLKAGGVIVRCISTEGNACALGGLIRDASPEDFVAEGETAIEEVTVKSLVHSGESVATAESCTGGLIASRITNVPGASRIFNVGLVTYSNEEKCSLLGVPLSMIEESGAVSERVATAMVEGCLERSRSDHCLSVTGIAGPGGGSETKPVGTVWIGLASRGMKAVAFHYRFKAERLYFKERASSVAIDLLRRRIQGYL